MMRYLAFILFLLTVHTFGSCPRNRDSGLQCSGQGECDTTNRCVCNTNHQGPDCSEKLCPYGVAWFAAATATDTVHYPIECSGRGKCNRQSGSCECDSGFTGSACQRLSCASSCSGHGQCISMKDLSTHNPDGDDRVYTDIWDSEKIYGCKCDLGYTGSDCSLRICPSGDDPLTKNQLNEIQLFQCTGNGGFFKMYFRGFGVVLAHDLTATEVESKLETLPTIFRASVTYSQGTTICNAALDNIVQIEFTHNFGKLPPLKAYSIVDGVSSLQGNGELIVVRGGFTLGGISSVQGTKEGMPCSNRGFCDKVKGECSCYVIPMPGYRSSDGYGNQGPRGDCGCVDNENYHGGAIKNCPGELPCSGHGVCSSTDFSCTCSNGWTGGDCSSRTCPTGLSWFFVPTANNDGHNTYTVCSDGGICEETSGECVCNDPFTGPACQYMKCPGLLIGCSGHGICMSLNQYATESTINGDPAGFTYGLDPNSAITWDAHKIFGCKCDDGYHGHACNLRTCSYGDDPSTTDQSDEVQVFSCTATEGTFKMTFRSKTTSSISFAASSSELEQAVESLSTIEDVDISFSSGTTVCTSTGSNAVSISFRINHGDLPKVSFNTDNLIDGANGDTPGSGSISIAVDGASLNGVTSVKGTKENVLCSNKGVCDTEFGTCICLHGYGSSDGRGNVGGRNDCGYRLPFFSIEK